MSEPLRIALVGSTGLVGSTIIDVCVGRPEVRLVGISRREVPLPSGARMEMFVAEPDKWGEVFEAVQPDALICALGTTWNKSGKEEAAFRAVDEELVLATARAALDHKVARLVIVSSVGADARSKNFYLRVKGEVENVLRTMKFHRLDILQPGLLRGGRSGDFRIGETLAKLASPLVDIALRGGASKYRSIDAVKVAEGALTLAARKAQGKFTHDNAGIMRAARDWEIAGPPAAS